MLVVLVLVLVVLVLVLLLRLADAPRAGVGLRIGQLHVPASGRQKNVWCRPAPWGLTTTRARFRAHRRPEPRVVRVLSLLLRLLLRLLLPPRAWVVGRPPAPPLLLLLLLFLPVVDGKLCAVFGGPHDDVRSGMCMPPLPPLPPLPSPPPSPSELSPWRKVPDRAEKRDRRTHTNGARLRTRRVLASSRDSTRMVLERQRWSATTAAAAHAAATATTPPPPPPTPMPP